ncbi:MAG: endolytic transglycosylase MltG [Coriobacteriales bacterium]|nr:endolytic transglycosylase MltG [Coriobacteriales bacterium]
MSKAPADYSDGDDWSQQGDQTYVGYSVDSLKRKSNPILTVIMFVVALAAVGLLIFGGYKLAEGLGLLGAGVVGDGEEVSIFIPEGSTTSEIASILKQNGVISRESSFISAVTARGVANSFQPGRYTLRTNMSDKEAIDALLEGTPVFEGGGNKLTIPEGLTIEATAARVEEVCGIPAAEFIAEARSADKYVADYPFLAGVYNNSMEGFLYPKTYMIPEDWNAERVVRRLLDQFVIETADLDMSYAESHSLSLYDLVIMGSMIEKETAAYSEYEIISSVLYNRMRDDMYLQICSTVVYAMGLENYDGHPLLESDLLIDSPYNTYQNSGLPAGPICSPRVETIIAAAHPAETNYFYYVLTSLEGTHTFCETYAEFEEANVVYRELFDVPA